MKVYTRIVLLVILGIMLLFMLSCSKENAPTTPNFEVFSPYMWDYDHVLWFDLIYDSKLGAASVNIMMSAKDETTSTTLKINNQPKSFTYSENYSEGKIYYGATAQINTTQPVTYEIVSDGKTYTGSMALPDEVMGNFPVFAQGNNFAPSWTITGDINPSFQVIEAYARGANNNDRSYTRQIAGTERNYSLLSTFWQDIAPVDVFTFGINAITYKMKNSNKVLTVGVSDDNYGWSDTSILGKSEPLPSKSKIMELIHQDMRK